MDDSGSKNVKFFNPGDMVFSESSRGEHMYILVNGAIELKKRTGSGEILLKRVDKPNDFFGEMALVDGAPRSATAVAVKPTNLLVVNRPLFEQLVMTNGQFALKIIRVLSDRIRNSNQHISDLIMTLPEERFICGMVEFARQYGEKIYTGGMKIGISQLKEWIKNNQGFSDKNIDTLLFKILKNQIVDYAPTSNKTKEDIVIPSEVLEQYDPGSLTKKT